MQVILDKQHMFVQAFKKYMYINDYVDNTFATVVMLSFSPRHHNLLEKEKSNILLSWQNYNCFYSKIRMCLLPGSRESMHAENIK